MKYHIYLLLFLFFSGCKPPGYLNRKDEDKALLEAVKKLNKSSGDEKALEAIPVLYKRILANRTDKIDEYNKVVDLSRYDKLLKEYTALQDAYLVIQASDAAKKLVQANNYDSTIINLKKEAAEIYYIESIKLLDAGGRDNARKAYTFLRKVEKYQTNYRDAAVQLNRAREAATVKVIINPIEDNSFGSGVINNGFNNDNFQQMLLRDLSYNTNRYAAKFYSYWQARRDNVAPDWTVNLRLRNLDIPYPSRSTYRRNASERIEVYRDSANNPVFQTVYATLHITRVSVDARVEMEMVIREESSGKTIYNNFYRDSYRRQDEYATYTGDKRALNSNDWQLVNNNNRYTMVPDRDQIVAELYRKIYPQVRSNIEYAAEW